MVAFSEAEVLAHERATYEWWSGRSHALFRLLTDYYHQPAVHPESPAHDSYEQLNRDRVGDGLLSILYDEENPWPCPYGPQGRVVRFFNPKAGEAESEAKLVCGLAQVHELVERQKERWPDMYAEKDDTSPASGVSAPASSSAASRSACIVYSLGSNNQFGFEGSVSLDTSCETWTFDCTSAPPTQSIPRVHFEPLCMGSDEFNGSGKNLQLRMFPMVHTPPGWRSQEARKVLERMQLTTWKHIAQERLKHSHVTLLKMDIEGGEYGVLIDMLEHSSKQGADAQSDTAASSSSSSSLPPIAPDQLTLELHWWNRGIGHAMLTLDTLSLLYRSGYRVMAHEKQHDTNCFEVNLVRVFC